MATPVTDSCVRTLTNVPTEVTLAMCKQLNVKTFPADSNVFAKRVSGPLATHVLTLMNVSTMCVKTTPHVSITSGHFRANATVDSATPTAPVWMSTNVW
jgi:hypothetical protein